MKEFIGRVIELIKLMQYALAGGRVKREKIDRIFAEVKDYSEKLAEFETAKLPRVGVAEDKEGVYLVELFYNQKTGCFRLKFPELEKNGPIFEIPRDYLPLISRTLEDVIWAKGKYTQIPDKTS